MRVPLRISSERDARFGAFRTYADRRDRNIVHVIVIRPPPYAASDNASGGSVHKAGPAAGETNLDTGRGGGVSSAYVVRTPGQHLHPSSGGRIGGVWCEYGNATLSSKPQCGPIAVRAPRMRIPTMRFRTGFRRIRSDCPLAAGFDPNRLNPRRYSLDHSANAAFDTDWDYIASIPLTPPFVARRKGTA